MTENSLLLVSYVVLWLVVIFQGALLIGLTSAVVGGTHAEAAAPHAAPTNTSPPLALGNAAPTFVAQDLDGRAVSNATLLGNLSALLFVQPRCQSCMTTLRELDMLSEKALGRITVVCGGDPDECARIRERYNVALPFVADAGRTIFSAFKVEHTPYAVLLDELGRIESTGKPLRPGDLAHESAAHADLPAEAHVG